MRFCPQQVMVPTPPFGGLFSGSSSLPVATCGLLAGAVRMIRCAVAVCLCDPGVTIHPPGDADDCVRSVSQATM
jgi:hypothetical protein